MKNQSLNWIPACAGMTGFFFAIFVPFVVRKDLNDG